MRSKDNSHKELVDRMRPIAMRLNTLVKQAVKQYFQVVADIINDESMDENRIEHALDGMLDFCYDKDMLKLYKALCRYYYGINPEAVVSYVHSYRDMWDEEYAASKNKRRVKKAAKRCKKKLA
jgi:DNA integrity scanning protein DisA with diadenylate cyclase activity